jgi:hypothetical protein
MNLLYLENEEKLPPLPMLAMEVFGVLEVCVNIADKQEIV